MISSSRGQATVEYILIFAFMAMIGLSMMRGIATGLSTSVKSLSYVLTQELSTGVCANRCFYGGYRNGNGN